MWPPVFRRLEVYIEPFPSAVQHNSNVSERAFFTERPPVAIIYKRYGRRTRFRTWKQFRDVGRTVNIDELKAHRDRLDLTSK